MPSALLYPTGYRERVVQMNPGQDGAHESGSEDLVRWKEWGQGWEDRCCVQCFLCGGSVGCSACIVRAPSAGADGVCQPGRLAQDIKDNFRPCAVITLEAH